MPAYPRANPRQFIQGAPVLHVLDVATTVRYYQEVLGFTCDFGDDSYSVVWRDNSAIHFVKDERPSSSIHLFQWVRNVDAYHEEIAPRGAKIASDPADQVYGVREMSVIDVNGIRIIFGQDIEVERPLPQVTG